MCLAEKNSKILITDISRKSNMARQRPYYVPQPAEVIYKGMRFLITDKPHNTNIVYYLDLLARHQVTDLVRVCEAEYDFKPIKDANIKVHDLEFPDGQYPPPYVVRKWFELLRNRFRQDENACIAIHCATGLGRAPVLVAITLLEAGLTCKEAVELIRTKRRGAINAKQLEYLERYKPRNRLQTNPKSVDKCCIM